MIIRDIGNDLLFVTQPDHARLASEIIAAWRPDGFPDHPRREAILYAAREHDNGWREEDAETLVDAAGTPVDFIAAPVPVKHRIWLRAVSRLADDHPYEAALVAQHALTVNADYREHPDWQAFFDTIEGLRRAALARAGAGAAATLENDYRFVNIADRLSLIFCNGWRERFDHRSASDSTHRRHVGRQARSVWRPPGPAARDGAASSRARLRLERRTPRRP